jgi:hypothetical protein
MIKLKRIRWLLPVTCMGKVRNTYEISAEKSKGRDCLRDAGVNGRITVEWILKKQKLA